MKQPIKDIEVGSASIAKLRLLAMLLALACFVTSCATTPPATEKPQSSAKQEIESVSAKEAPFLVKSHTKLFISVYGEPDLTGEVMVGADGAIDYGYIGKIVVQGLTPKQIEGKLTHLLQRDFLIHPQVTVKVREYGQVYVFGQVNNPGIVPLTADLSALEAIVEAGGFSGGARRDWLEVVRMVNGKKQATRLSLRETGNGSLEMPQHLHLLPEDTIIVQ